MDATPCSDGDRAVPHLGAARIEVEPALQQGDGRSPALKHLSYAIVIFNWEANEPGAANTDKFSRRGAPGALRLGDVHECIGGVKTLGGH
jgi:hypothetical protein